MEKNRPRRWFRLQADIVGKERKYVVYIEEQQIDRWLDRYRGRKKNWFVGGSKVNDILVGF